MFGRNRVQWPSSRLLVQAVLILLLPLAHREAQAAEAPRWWKLRCARTEPQSAEWEVCNLMFYADTACTRPHKMEMQSALKSQAIGWVDENLKIGEWAVSVQCVKFEECPETLAPTPPTMAPLAPAVQQSTPEAAPAPTPEAGPAPTPNQWQDFQNQFNGLNGDDDQGRRLSSFTSNCADLVLEHSTERNSANPTMFANWVGEDAKPDEKHLLRLSQATARSSLPTATLALGDGSPAYWPGDFHREGGCDGGCDGKAGLSKSTPIELSFNASIFPGAGRFAMNDIMQIDATDSEHLTWIGSKLTFDPLAFSWGSAGACAKFFVDGAVSDIHGNLYPPTAFYFCVKDEKPPTILQTEPVSQGKGVEIANTRLTLVFDEHVVIASGGGNAEVRPKSPWMGNGAVPETHIINLKSQQVSVNANFVNFHLQTVLMKKTTYELVLPPGGIEDRAGNDYPGNVVLIFTTYGDPTPSPPSLPSPNRGGDNEGISSDSDSDGSSNVGAVIGGIMAVITAACCGICCLMVFKHLVRTGQERLKEDEEQASTTKVTPAFNPNSYQNPAGTQFGHLGGAASPSSESSAHRAAKSTPVGMEANNGPRQAAHAPWGEGKPGMPKSTGTDPTSRRRPAEAEDAATGTRTRPQMHRSGSFYDDDVTADGWVQSVDPGSGRSYWYHAKTRETRWDPPPKAGGTSTAGHASPKEKATFSNPPRGFKPGRPQPDGKQGQQGQQAQQGGGGPAAGGAASGNGQVPGQVEEEDAGDSEEVKRVKADVREQLTKTQAEDAASRKKTFKFLCLRWHPDKNADNPELATAIFQYLQVQKDWYLKEE